MSTVSIPLTSLLSSSSSLPEVEVSLLHPLCTASLPDFHPQCPRVSSRFFHPQSSTPTDLFESSSRPAGRIDSSDSRALLAGSLQALPSLGGAGFPFAYRRQRYSTSDNVIDN